MMLHASVHPAQKYYKLSNLYLIKAVHYQAMNPHINFFGTKNEHK